MFNPCDKIIYMKNTLISVVIPCYGSENTIEEVVINTIKTLNKRKNKYEIILINDSSPDNVWSKIVKLHNNYPRIITGINFTKNFGQHAAVMAGYKEAAGGVVVIVFTIARLTVNPPKQRSNNANIKYICRLYY